MGSRQGFIAGLCLALAAGIASAQTPANPTPRLNIIPAPASAQLRAGAGPRIADGTPIVVPANDPEAASTARYLSALVLRTRGLTLPVLTAATPRTQDAAILLVRAPAPTGEGYGLQAAEGKVVVSAHDDAGLFYGAVTAWQLITAQPGRGPADIAAVDIADAPRFAWRGLMIDSARHFQPPAEIEQMIDAMALHKLNVLHWHLTDDQGWRLQIRKYPRLTGVGAWRTPTKGSPDGPGRYGGFYTQGQVREIVAYAAARHVTIVPEIEMPGHAVSALLAYPQFAAGAPPLRADQAKWGGFPSVYATGDKTYAFLTDVLTEVMGLFPGRFIHVGGDEVMKERWNALGSPDPSAQQQAFTHRIAAFLEAHHRRLVGWDEILQGGDLPADAVVTSWHGIDGGIAAANKGHDAVLAPAPVMYFDNRQGLGPEEPPGRGWLIRLQDAYNFEPLPPTLTPAAAAHIIGLQANVWTEHVRTADQLEAMVFPRLAGMAETAWSPAGPKDWPGFAYRLPAQLARYEALGLHPDRAAVSVLVTPAASGGVTLASQSPGEIRYTLDGSEPGAASALFQQPISVTSPTPLRAALFMNGRRVGPTEARTLDAAGLSTRQSQDLRLCNEKLALNLEGGPATGRRSYLINPVDPCWLFVGADLTHVRRLSVTFARIPFNFGLGTGENSALVHPSRTLAGDLEVRQDSCNADRLAVASLPLGPRGAIILKLPPRSGRHDLCFTFTGRGYDPTLAIEQVRLVEALP